MSLDRIAFQRTAFEAASNGTSSVLLEALRSEQKPAEKQVEKPAEQQGEKPAEKQVEKPAVKIDPVKLVEQLGNDEFYQREAAQKALIKAGVEAVPAVYEARDDIDPERRRRANTILEHLARTLELKELMKAPQLLGYFPQWSLSDRRAAIKQNISDNPNDPDEKRRLERLVTEADFVRAHPDYVKSRVKELEERNKRADLRPYEYEQNDRFIASLKEISKLAAEVRIDCLSHAKDADEKRRLAMEALEISPATIVDNNSMRWTLQNAGLFKDSKFITAFVKADGDPSWAEGEFYKWEEVDKALDGRLERARKDTSEKKTENLIKALHMVASANEHHGSLDKAIRLYGEELELRRKANPTDSGLRTEIFHLASLQLKVKQTDGAIKSFETIREMEKDVSPIDDNGMRVLDNLVALYEGKGDKKKAIELGEEAIKRGQFPQYSADQLADRHIRVAASKEGLKDLKGAEENLKEAVKAITQEGTDYPWAGKSLIGLAGFYARQGRQAEAIPFYRRAVNVSGSRFNKEHEPALKGLIECLEKEAPKSDELAQMRKKLADWQK